METILATDELKFIFLKHFNNRVNQPGLKSFSLGKVRTELNYKIIHKYEYVKWNDMVNYKW